MWLRQIINRKRKQFTMFSSDKDHVSALLFDAKRKYEAGMIDDEQYEDLINHAKEKESKLSAKRKDFWTADRQKRRNNK